MVLVQRNITDSKESSNQNQQNKYKHFLNTHLMNTNVLEIQTVQISALRTLMTALKDILLETNIFFQPDGIRIKNMDKSHSIFVHLFLEAENFEKYFCKYPKVVIGVNMFHLFKIINTVDNDDALTIYINEEDYNDGSVDYLCLRFENGDIKQYKTHKLRLIGPEPEEMTTPNVSYSSIITLPSSDFQKIVRDMNDINADKIEIKSVGNELIFSAKGGFSESQICRTEMNGKMDFVMKDDQKIIQGEFSLKNLGYFIKCTNLCSTIEMYLENDIPLIIKYAVASLGEIKLCLAPTDQ